MRAGRSRGVAGVKLDKVATGSYFSNMIETPIKQAKNRLSELVREVEETGQTVVITRNGKAVADLVPHRAKTKLDFDAVRRFNEKHGIKGLVTYIAPDFDDPLPEDFLLRPLPDPVKPPKTPRKR